MLSSGKEKKDAHPPEAHKEHVKVAEAVEETEKEPTPEPAAAEPVTNSTIHR